MKIQDIMSTDPSTVTPDTPITEAARLMKDHNVGMLPVVEVEGSRKLVGVVTDRTSPSVTSQKDIPLIVP